MWGLGGFEGMGIRGLERLERIGVLERVGGGWRDWEG